MIVDIINKKRLGQELNYKELEFFFNNYLKERVKDYQMSALLMAICINGMTDEEIFSLTKIFIDSGDILDFDINAIKVDKHSTGGVGDKTTLVIAPIVAACKVPVVKMSGRGLGYTGGTIDKLESIPGFKTDLSEEEIINQAKEIGLVISGQTANLVPLDKKIYALRDVTGTVSSIPLIATSIMSKKIASGNEKILIDIKVGSGALIKTQEEAHKLSTLMKKIGSFYNKEVRTVISDMNIPLGRCIGNSLEVLEAIDILQGKETDSNLVELCIELASEMVSMGKEISKVEALKEVKKVIDDKSAYNKLLELVKSQKGNINNIKISDKVIEIKAKKTGTITNIDALELGKLSVKLGAGRETKEDLIDYGVGFRLNKLIGQKVKKDDVICYVYIETVCDLSNIDNIFEIN